MPAVKLGRGQIEKAVLILVDEPATFLGRGPILAGNFERRAQSRGLSLDNGERLARLTGDHRRHAGLEDTGLFGGHLDQRVTQKFAMIEREPGNDACQRAFDHVRGVKPPTKTDLEQDNVGRVAREQQECCGGLHFEHGDRRAAVFRFAFGQRVAERGVVDEPPATVPAEAKAFVETNQIRRSVDVNPLAGGFERRAHERDGGAFAVGAGYMNGRRQPPLRIVERAEEPLDAIEG